MSDEQALTDWQKAKLLNVMRLGADRPTACHYVGVVETQLQAALAADEAFARDVLQAQAEAEVQHLGNIHRASQDEKNWRTSAWWLERRGLGRLSGASVAQALARVAELVEVLGGIIAEEITDGAKQRRLIERLLAAVHWVEEPESVIITDVKLLTASAPETPACEASAVATDEEEAP